MMTSSDTPKTPLTASSPPHSSGSESRVMSPITHTNISDELSISTTPTVAFTPNGSIPSPGTGYSWSIRRGKDFLNRKLGPYSNPLKIFQLKINL